MITVNPQQAQVLIQDCMNVNLVPLLKGSPGTSKSSIMKRIAKERNLKLIDIRLAQIDEVELNGFPDLSGDKATYKQFDIFPTEGTSVPVGYNGWLLFFDELTSADKNKQGAAYKIILDRMVGQETLHENAFCVAAGNLLTDKAVVNNMSTAMQSRLIHINMGVDKDDWINWAIGADIDNRVISFIEYQPGNLHKFDPAHQDDTFACQRTWEFVSQLIKPMSTLTASKLPLIAGTVSEGVAREFKAFCELSEGLVTFPEILKDPVNSKVPTDAGSLYASVGMLANNVNQDNLEVVMGYITRMPTEFQLCTLRRAFNKDRNITKVPKVFSWLQENANKWL
tara:strand:+ start:24388 stop:25404 length:1017 start_codon:yes stop_codon:yes gene_type:complete